MSDVHIGKSNVIGEVRKIQLILHIPITNPIAGIVPTAASIIDSSLKQAERDKLVVGELIEDSTKTITLQSNQNISDQKVTEKIKLIFNNIKNDYNSDFDAEYKDFGTEINANT